MPLDKIFTALILGLSWERMLYCPFLALSLSLSSRWQGLRFVLGRLLGICLLGLMVTMFGLPFNISPRLIDGAFGLFLFGLGIITFFKSEHKNPQKRFSHTGFGLGLFRGFLNPGRKIICLLPLLWGVKILDGLVLSLTYALSSSIYLLIGFFSAEILNKIFAYQKKIKITGAIILFLLGAFYIWRAFRGYI